MFEKILNCFGFKNNNNNVFLGVSILVIEDNEIDRKVIVKILESYGAVVLTAATGQTGLQNAKSALNLDLILLDFRLPDSEGHDICRELKACEQTRDIPVIVLTGENTATTLVDCYDVGADYYLTKPINSKALIKHVKLTLEESRLAAG